MNIVVRIKISSKLKNSSPEVGYYSYTNRYRQPQERPCKIEQTVKKDEKPSTTTTRNIENGK